jgi:hypothetical protein
MFRVNKIKSRVSFNFSTVMILVVVLRACSSAGPLLVKVKMKMRKDHHLFTYSIFESYSKRLEKNHTIKLLNNISYYPLHLGYVTLAFTKT